MDSARYIDGAYLEANSTWHVEDSDWKYNQILKILDQNKINARSIGEVGCGAGEVLSIISKAFPEKTCEGYDISPQAIALAQARRSENLQFHNADIALANASFDLLLALDVIEHIEDCFAFTRKLRSKAEWKVFHIPLDCNAISLIRGWPILEARREVGHIHYFFKDTALCFLRECGYEIVDFFYTCASEAPSASKSWKASLMNGFRHLLFKIRPDLAARLLGGYSLMVLAR